MVIGIIGVLAGLLVPTIGIAQRRSKISNTKNDINVLTVAIEHYEGRFRDYPPTELSILYEGETGNGLNDGIETLLAVLTSKRDGPACLTDIKEDQLANLDEDQIKLNETYADLNWTFGDRQLREYVDHFGNPYVYVHNADYERSYRVTTVDGEKVTVRCRLSKETKAHHSPQSYQIWSLGPDGVNSGGHNDDDAGEDDIASW